MHELTIITLLGMSVGATLSGCANGGSSFPAQTMCVLVEPNQVPPPPWRADEDKFFSHPTQLTFPDRFVKAGEAYFSPDAKQIIFQAIEQPAAGAKAADFYSMFVADLVTSDSSTKIENVREVSLPGSANTCGWFDEAHPGRIIFGTTVTPPANKETPGYQRGTSKYRWQFPPEMRVVAVDLGAAAGSEGSPQKPIVLVGDGTAYHAECSTSADGRWLLFCALDGGQGNIYVKDLTTGAVTPLVTAQGYDGGPFFSNDGRSICYRSDRNGDSLLQIQVSDLVFDHNGAITGARNERKLTANEHVNWAPYYSPGDALLIYAGSEVGHDNYELFTVTNDAAATRTRVTFAPGADVLPVFDRAGDRLLWTSQRGAGKSSQLWIADWTGPRPWVKTP